MPLTSLVMWENMTTLAAMKRPISRVASLCRGAGVALLSGEITFTPAGMAVF